MAEHTPNAGVLELAKQLQQATDQRDALLKALENCREVLAGGMYHNAPCVDQAHDAIRLARGEPNRA